MPSAFSHAISAAAPGFVFKKKNEGPGIIILGMLCSVLPDADVISFHYGIAYSSMWGHRGITHSFFFAALLALIVVIVFYRKTNSVSELTIKIIYLFLATALHPLLDACTNGGLGVAFFAPFNNERYFFPFRPIKVSPISAAGFFTTRGLEIFKNELLWIWLPSILFILSVRIFKRRVNN